MAGMKRFELMAAQHDFLRQAAFAVVRRDGVGALTRRALASELGISDSVVRRNLDPTVLLPRLVVRACAERRREARYRQPRPRTLRDLTSQVLPGAETLDVEAVWWRLRLHVLVVPSPLSDGLRARYELAVRGHGEGEHPTAPAPPADAELAAGLAAELAAHDETVEGVVALLVSGDQDQVAPVTALVRGLSLSVCLGLLDPTAARQVLCSHLELLGADLDADRTTGAPGPD